MQESDAQVPVPPAEDTGNSLGGGNPPRNNNRLLATVVGVLAVLLVLFLAVLLINRANAAANPTAGTILDSAKKAALKDAQYTLQGQLALNLSGTGAGTATPAASPSTSFAIDGTGKLTTAPARNDIQLNIPALGVQTGIEALTDSNDVYVQLGALAGLTGITGSGANNWIKVAAGTSKPMTILDSYSAIKNPTIVGSEKINGKDTWHIKGNLDTNGTANNATAAAIGATATSVAKTSGVTIAATTTEDIWIIKDTYFPAKIMVHAGVTAAVPSGLLPTGGFGLTGTTTAGTTATPTVTSGTATSSPIQLAVDVTITFTAWNSNLTIAPPPASQVTDLGNGSSIFALPTATVTPVK